MADAGFSPSPVSLLLKDEGLQLFDQPLLVGGKLPLCSQTVHHPVLDLRRGGRSELIEDPPRVSPKEHKVLAEDVISCLSAGRKQQVLDLGVGSGEWSGVGMGRARCNGG